MKLLLSLGLGLALGGSGNARENRSIDDLLSETYSTLHSHRSQEARINQAFINEIEQTLKAQIKHQFNIAYQNIILDEEITSIYPDPILQEIVFYRTVCDHVHFFLSEENLSIAERNDKIFELLKEKSIKILKIEQAIKAVHYNYSKEVENQIEGKELDIQHIKHIKNSALEGHFGPLRDEFKKEPLLAKFFTKEMPLKKLFNSIDKTVKDEQEKIAEKMRLISNGFYELILHNRIQQLGQD